MPTTQRTAATPTVLWDFDGTLAARKGMWRSALLTALDQVTADHGVTMELLRGGLKNSFPWHTPETPHPQLHTPELWWAQLGAVFRRAYAAAGVSESTAEQAAEAVRAIYLDDRYWSVFDDVRPSLQRLRENDYRNVILSNHVPELGDLVDRLGLAELIEFVLTSAVTGHEKPHPVMFDIALELTGHPDRVWMVGDNPIVDVAGATAAGIPAILVRTPDSTGHTIGLDQAVNLIICNDQDAQGNLGPQLTERQPPSMRVCGA